MAYLEYFDERRLQLQQELMHHPDMCALIANHPSNQFEVRLCEIAAAVGILVDGAYTEEEISNLCEILTKRLYARRSGIVTLTDIAH